MIPDYPILDDTDRFPVHRREILYAHAASHISGKPFRATAAPLSLSDRYLALESVRQLERHGAAKNLRLFRQHESGLRSTIHRWKSNPLEERGLAKVLWEYADASGNRELLHFSPRRQRYYLATGLFEFAKLLCDEINRQLRTEPAFHETPVIDEPAL